MSSALNAAIAAAREQAANVPANVPATVSQAPVPANTNGAGMSMSFADFRPAVVPADEFLKVKEFGLLIGKSDGIIQGFKAIINPWEIDISKTIRWGNPARYEHTKDGQYTLRGRPWFEVVAEAQRIDDKAVPYMSATFLMELAEDVEAKNMQGKVVDTFPAGLLVGYSTPPTGAGEADKFRRALEARGLMNVPVLVDVGYKPRKNAKGNVWANVTWTLIGPAEE